MAYQGIPICSGGPDANSRVGNVFILALFEADRDEREACRAAALCYLTYPPRKAATAAAKKGKKQKDAETGRDAEKTDCQLPEALVLLPELAVDSWERERSQAALAVWCAQTRRFAIANAWRAVLNAKGFKGFLAPQESAASEAARKAEEAAGAERRAQKEQEETAEAEAVNARQQPPAGPDGEPVEAGEPEAAGVTMSRAEAEQLGLTRLIEGNDIRRDPDVQR